MLTASVPLALPPAGVRRAPNPEINVGRDVPGYTGPRDGLSHPAHGWLCRPLNKALIAGCFRMEVEGRENLPEDGPHLYCPTHPSMFDPPLIAALTPRDIRYIANIFVFDGIRGKLMTWGGAFPVFREKPEIRTIRHCRDIVAAGKGLCIFPEGGIADAEKDGKVGPLKKGAAWFAVRGGARTMVPIAIDYVPNTRKRPTETAIGIASSVLLTAGTAAAAMAGGPVARVAAGVVSGVVAGAYAVGKTLYERTKNPEWFDQFPKYFATLNGGLAGAAIGGVLGGVCAAFGHSPAVAALTSLAGGLGAWGIARGWRDRDIAKVFIDKPIEVAPYREKHATTKEAVTALTADLHRAIGHAKQHLNGIPYNDNDPKFRGAVIETLKQTPKPAA